jgi:amidase
VSDGALPFDGATAVAMLSDVTEGTFARRLDVLSGQIGVAITPQDLEYRSTTLVAAGQRIDDARYALGWERAQQMVSAYLDQFDKIDIWMTPTFSTEIVKIGVFGPDVAWHDQRDDLLDFAGYCWIDNFAGTPSISLPMGFSDNSMPVGVQFATRPGGEALLLALAYQLEAAVEWWRHTPPIWVGDDSFEGSRDE